MNRVREPLTEAFGSWVIDTWDTMTGGLTTLSPPAKILSPMKAVAE
jgi:hypothetical protein